MPNWCHNNLQISGTAEEIEAIDKLLFREKQGPNGEAITILDFNLLVPMPPELDIDNGSTGVLGHPLEVLLGSSQVQDAAPSY